MRLTFPRMMPPVCNTLRRVSACLRGTAPVSTSSDHRVAYVLLGAGLAIAATSLVGKTRWVEVFDLSLAIGVWLMGAAATVTLTGGDQAAHRQRTSGLRSKLDHRFERLSDLHWRIEDSATRYRDLLDELDAVVYRRDQTGRLTFVNRVFCRYFGTTSADALGTAFRPPGLSPTMSISIPPGGQPRQYTAEVVTSLGRRWFSFVEHQVPGGDGDGAELQCVARDVTRERESARELATAKDQAETASRAKSRFLAAVSHEIRTPMNGILGMVGLMADTQQTLEQQSYLRTIEQSARQLLGLIDEVLDFSRLEAKKLELDSDPFSVEILVQDVVELLAPRAMAKDLELAWSIEPSLPALCRGDAARIRQIVLNLVGNAIKFTDRGGVWIEVGGESDDNGRWRLSFMVRDTGIGLSPEAMSRIFGEFEQAAEQGRDRRGGTGLGLSISQALARAMGGEISVSSRPDRGATFSFDVVLPEAGSDRLYPDFDAAKSVGGPVLIMLDRLIERRNLATQLRRAGFEVEEADTLEGPELVKAARAGQSPHAIVVVDGEDGAVQLNGLIDADVTRGFVIVAANARADLKAFRASGFDEFLIRPVRPRTLLQLAHRLEGDPAPLFERPVEPPTEQPREPAPRPAVPSEVTAASQAARRILLVEDNPVNALVATRALEKFDCAVVGAGDGLAAVAHMRRVLARTEPAVDVILMDMNMPHMGGAEATRAIRSLYAEAGHRAVAVPAPPIIAVTAYAFEEDRRRCFAAGMDDYLAKPFSRGDLERCIERWTRGAALSRETGPQPPSMPAEM